jgi:hypothetical protein
LVQVHPAAFANQGRRQKSLVTALEHGDLPPGLDAFEMESGNDPIVGKSETDVGIMVEWNHPAFLLCRIIASFSFRVIALIAASRFKAAL